MTVFSFWPLFVAAGAALARVWRLGSLVVDHERRLGVAETQLVHGDGRMGRVERNIVAIASKLGVDVEHPQ